MTRPYESTSQFLSTLNEPHAGGGHLAGSQALRPERTAEFGEVGGFEKTDEDDLSAQYTPEQGEHFSAAKMSTAKIRAGAGGGAGHGHGGAGGVS